MGGLAQALSLGGGGRGRECSWGTGPCPLSEELAKWEAVAPGSGGAGMGQGILGDGGRDTESPGEGRTQAASCLLPGSWGSCYGAGPPELQVRDSRAQTLKQDWDGRGQSP